MKNNHFEMSILSDEHHKMKDYIAIPREYITIPLQDEIPLGANHQSFKKRAMKVGIVIIMMIPLPVLLMLLKGATNIPLMVLVLFLVCVTPILAVRKWVTKNDSNSFRKFGLILLGHTMCSPLFILFGFYVRDDGSDSILCFDNYAIGLIFMVAIMAMMKLGWDFMASL